MTAYRVTVLHDACTTHDVEADTESDAIHAAMLQGSVSLCHQCSRQIDMGDPIRAACVENLNTGESNLDPDPDHEVVQLRARVAELEGLRAEVEALKADGERLDYIASNARCDPKMDGQHVWWPTSFNHRLVGPNLRAAIDAAKGGGNG